MRRLAVVGLSLAAILLPFCAQPGAAETQSSNMKQTAMPILTLAMDGARVVYMRTDRLVGVWNVNTGVTSVIKGTYPSKGNFGPGNGWGYGEVAISGKRVALITRWVIGNSQESQERLYTAPLGGRAHQLGSRTDHSTDPQDVEAGDPGFSTGDWIAGLVGSTKVLAVSTWKSDNSVPTHGRLNLVTPSGLRKIVSGPGAIVAESADGGHIAVLRSTVAWPADDVGPATAAPTVGIYSARGKLLRQIVPSSGSTEVALSGKNLVVLTKSLPPTGGVTSTLEVYDWTTGTRVLHLAVHGQLAVVEEAHTLHVLDLTTGKDVLIAATGSGRRDAAIGPLGLVYADNSYLAPNGGEQHGALLFVPTAKLLAALGR